jgi:hypothetical protein
MDGMAKEFVNYGSLIKSRTISLGVSTHYSRLEVRSDLKDQNKKNKKINAILSELLLKSNYEYRLAAGLRFDVEHALAKHPLNGLWAWRRCFELLPVLVKPGLRQNFRQEYDSSG